MSIKEEQNLYGKLVFGGVLPAEYEGQYRIGVRCDNESHTCRLTVYLACNRRYETLFSCGGIIGANGTGKTAEGDNKTPLGTYITRRAYGIKDDPESRVPYTKITADMYWCGDSGSENYNTLVYADKPTSDNDEHLIDYAGYYNYLLDIGYNISRTPHAGSALFLHCRTDEKQTTAGCIAIDEEYMVKVLRTVKEGTPITIY